LGRGIVPEYFARTGESIGDFFTFGARDARQHGSFCEIVEWQLEYSEGDRYHRKQVGMIAGPTADSLRDRSDFCGDHTKPSY